MADAQAKENTGATAENVVSNADTGDTDGQVVAQQEQDGQVRCSTQFLFPFIELQRLYSTIM